MAQVSETCSCGAQFTLIIKDNEFPQTAVAEWRTNHRHDIKPVDDGFRPAGGNTAGVERRGESDHNHELNANDRPLHYFGRGISLKWHES